MLKTIAFLKDSALLTHGIPLTSHSLFTALTIKTASIAMTRTAHQSLSHRLWRWELAKSCRSKYQKRIIDHILTSIFRPTVTIGHVSTLLEPLRWATLRYVKAGQALTMPLRKLLSTRYQQAVGTLPSKADIAISTTFWASKLSFLRLMLSSAT